jgi:hypothetical protein
MSGWLRDVRRGSLVADRLDDEEPVGGADDPVGTCVRRRDDELPAPAPVPFDVERQPHAAVGPRAFATYALCVIRSRGVAPALLVPGAPCFSQCLKEARTLERERRAILLDIDRPQAHAGRSGENLHFTVLPFS